MKKSNTRFRVYLVKILDGVWFEKKCGVFSIYFQFLWDPPQKTLVWLCFLYLVFIFSIKKTVYNFWVFSFSWKWISWYFRKKTNSVDPTNSELSYQKLSLSLSLSKIYISFFFFLKILDGQGPLQSQCGSATKVTKIKSWKSQTQDLESIW